MAAIVRIVRVLPRIHLRQTLLRATGNSCLVKFNYPESVKKQPFSSLNRCCDVTRPKFWQISTRQFDVIRPRVVPLTQKDIEKMVFDVLENYPKIDQEKLKELRLDCRFTEDLGMDSLDIAELVNTFEEELEFDFPEDQLADVTMNAHTVGGLIDRINALADPL